MANIDQDLVESVTNKPNDIEQAIDQAVAILKAAGAEEVYLFGSSVSGQTHLDSDIDLAVAGLPPGKFFEAMGRIQLILPRPLDLIDLEVNTPFIIYLKEKGKLHRVA